MSGKKQVALAFSGLVGLPLLIILLLYPFNYTKLPTEARPLVLEVGVLFTGGLLVLILICAAIFFHKEGFKEALKTLLACLVAGFFIFSLFYGFYLPPIERKWWALILGILMFPIGVMHIFDDISNTKEKSGFIFDMMMFLFMFIGLGMLGIFYRLGFPGFI